MKADKSYEIRESQIEEEETQIRSQDNNENGFNEYRNWRGQRRTNWKIASRSGFLIAFELDLEIAHNMIRKGAFMRLHSLKCVQK